MKLLRLTVAMVLILLISPIIIAFPVRAGTPQSLPSFCGPVGTAGYKGQIKRVTLQEGTWRGTVITVDTLANDTDGDTSSVGALEGNPGPDGTTSLQEAILATNNNPGSYTIDFAPSLAGGTIWVSASSGVAALPPLTGGAVTINGYIGGVPGVTIATKDPNAWGFLIDSSGDTINGVRMVGFIRGISLPGYLYVPSGTTFTNDSITNNILNVTFIGIDVEDNPPSGGSTTWSNLLVAGNTIYSNGSYANGLIVVAGSGTSDDLMVGTRILDNHVYVNATSPGNGLRAVPGVAVTVDTGSYFDTRFPVSQGNRMVNTLIEGNFISAANWYSSDIVDVISGVGGADNVIEGLTIVNNTVSAPQPNANSSGITLSGGVEVLGSSVGRPTGNLLDNVTLVGNVVEGATTEGITLLEAGINNTMSHVSAYDNNITIGWEDSAPDLPTQGFRIESSGEIQYGKSTGNLLANVNVWWNDVNFIKPIGGLISDGIILAGGIPGNETVRNTEDNVSVEYNYINTGYDVGIGAFGGLGGLHATVGNVLKNLTISCNEIVSNPGPPRSPSGLGGIELVGGNDNATSNALDNVTLGPNLVEGALDNGVATLNLPPLATSNGIGFTTTRFGLAANATEKTVDIWLTTNSSLEGAGYSQASRSLTYELNPITGVLCFANITIPKSLLGGSPTVSIDGTRTRWTLVQNSTHYFIYTEFPSFVHVLQISGAAAQVSTSTESTSTTTSSSSTTKASSLATSVSATSASGSEGIPEFPYQALIEAAVVVVIGVSYIVTRRHH